MVLSSPYYSKLSHSGKIPSCLDLAMIFPPRTVEAWQEEGLGARLALRWGSGRVRAPRYCRNESPVEVLRIVKLNRKYYPDLGSSRISLRSSTPLRMHFRPLPSSLQKVCIGFTILRTGPTPPIFGLTQLQLLYQSLKIALQRTILTLHTS